MFFLLTPNPPLRGHTEYMKLEEEAHVQTLRPRNELEQLARLLSQDEAKAELVASQIEEHNRQKQATEGHIEELSQRRQRVSGAC